MINAARELTWTCLKWGWSVVDRTPLRTVALPCLAVLVVRCPAMPCRAVPRRPVLTFLAMFACVLARLLACVPAGRLAGLRARWHACSFARLLAGLLGLRRSNEVEFVGAETLLLDQVNNGNRTFLRAKFRKTGASTPGRSQGDFIVTVSHTRSGSKNSGFKIIGRSNPLQFKQDRAK